MILTLTLTLIKIVLIVNECIGKKKLKSEFVDNFQALDKRDTKLYPCAVVFKKQENINTNYNENSNSMKQSDKNKIKSKQNATRKERARLGYRQ